jgi:hypothetical protein
MTPARHRAERKWQSMTPARYWWERSTGGSGTPRRVRARRLRCTRPRSSPNLSRIRYANSASLFSQRAGTGGHLAASLVRERTPARGTTLPATASRRARSSSAS